MKIMILRLLSILTLVLLTSCNDEYYTNGNIRKSKKVINNVLIEKEFYENGQLKKISRLKNNKKIGNEEVWDSLGYIRFVYDYSTSSDTVLTQEYRYIGEDTIIGIGKSLYRDTINIRIGNYQFYKDLNSDFMREHYILLNGESYLNQIIVLNKDKIDFNREKSSFYIENDTIVDNGKYIFKQINFYPFKKKYFGSKLLYGKNIKSDFSNLDSLISKGYFDGNIKVNENRLRILLENNVKNFGGVYEYYSDSTKTTKIKIYFHSNFIE